MHEFYFPKKDILTICENAGDGIKNPRKKKKITPKKNTFGYPPI